MKKLLLLALLPLLFVSCSKDSDSPNEPVQEPSEVIYSVNLHNDIKKSAVSNSSDGNLYDVYVVSQNGEVYSIGTVANGKVANFKFPKGYNKSKVFFFILKFGKTEAKSKESDYWSPEKSYGKLLSFFVDESKPIEVYITENTTYSSFSCKDIANFKNMLQSVLSGLGQ